MSIFYLLVLSFKRFMSPVSLVFQTVVTVRIGLKTQLEWEPPFHNIRCLCWLAERSTFQASFKQSIHIFYYIYSISMSPVRAEGTKGMGHFWR